MTAPPHSRVLLAHVPYRTPGGECQHVEALAEIYRELGVEVIRIPTSETSPTSLAAVFARPSLPSALHIQGNRPTFAHLHNIHPTLGVAFLQWLEQEQLPAIMTVHNHRFYCTNGLALRHGTECKACLRNTPMWRPIAHNCNENIAKSIYHAIALHRIRSRNLWNRSVNIFLAPNSYIANELVRSGIEAEKVRLFPHFVEVPPAPREAEKEFDLVYGGRLSPEKGIREILGLAKQASDLRFLITGTGPLAEEVRLAAASLPNLTFLEGLGRESFLRQLHSARTGIAPSLCHEAFSLFSVECLLSGLSMVVAENESMAWLTASPFGAYAGDPRRPESLLAAARLALARSKQGPAPNYAEMRAQFSRENYKRGLAALIGSLPFKNQLEERTWTNVAE